MSANELISKARAQQRTSLDEQAGKSLLAAYGITVPQSLTVKTAGEVDAAFGKLKPPVVVKIMSPDILHKSDAGGVSVGLNAAAEVEDAVRAMMRRPAIESARIDGFLLEEMAPAGVEMVVGGLRDPQFGPLVMAGLGGVFVEVLADVAFRICPITRLDAAEMLDELKGVALLDGARGRVRASREAIIDVLLKVGSENGLLLQHADDFKEADINPLIVDDRGVTAVDARIVVAARHGTPHPYSHLAIHPYPAEMVTDGKLRDGEPFLLRPIRPEDAEMEQAFVRRLSPASRYFRFMGALRELTPAMLVRFTQIDYDREMALMVVANEDGKDVCLGVARYASFPDGVNCDFAVVVDDQQTGMGIAHKDIPPLNRHRDLDLGACL